MAEKYIAVVKKTTLQSNLTTTGTTVKLKKFQDSKGNNLALSDFGAWFVVVIKQGDNMEMIKCSAISIASDDVASLTVASSGRNLSPTTPYSGSGTGLAFTAGAEVIVSNDGLSMGQFGNLNNAQTWALLQTFTVMPQSSDVPTSGADLINKTYADALVLGSLTTLNVIVPATAGETIAAGNLVYYDTTDKEWKLCDADTAATVENVMTAIAQGAGTDGNAITGGVLLRGMDSNQSGMTAGDIMYAGNTAGAIANSAGTKEVTVGVAKSATQLYFNPRFNQMLTEDQQDALAGNLGTPASGDKYVTQTGLQKGAEIYAADAEANDTYVITLSPVPASYYTGMVIHFKANTANTGAATLNVNSLGAKTIKKRHDQDLATGDIESGQIVTVVYDGTNFQMQSQLGLTPTDNDFYGFIASDNLQQSADTERTQAGVTPVKKKEIQVRRSGTVRIKFDLKNNITASGADHGRIYVNGVAVGTGQTTGDSTYVTFSEDISGIEIGDLIQLYAWNTNSNTTSVRNFRIYWDISTSAISTVETD